MRGLGKPYRGWNGGNQFYCSRRFNLNPTFNDDGGIDAAKREIIAL
jgi:hypothetical protein